MTDRESQKLVENFLSDLGKENNIECYTKHAEQYERGIIGCKYVAPEWCAKTALQHVNTGAKKMQALDVCVGTGLTSEYLVKNAFKGDIDGVDGNSAMLQQAAKKGIFRNLVQHILTPDTKLPFSDNTYDIVVCTGGLSAGHVSLECLPDIFRVLKIGGTFSFNTTKFNLDDDKASDEDMNKVDSVLKELAEAGVCELMEQTVCDMMKNVSPDFKYCKGNVVKLHCYRKNTKE